MRDTVAHLFNLWNLYQSNERTCEFDVTPANSPRLRDGSKDFITACLNELGIDSAPVSWCVAPFRCYYFSDYIRPTDRWEDRWAIGWNIQVELKQPQKDIGTLSGLPVYSDALDLSWEDGYRDPRHESSALLISVHAGSATGAIGAQMRLLEYANRTQKQPGPTSILFRTYNKDLHQTRVLFSGVSFPGWVEMADELVRFCRESGEMVNFRELLLRPKGT